MERPNAWKSYKKSELKKVEALAVKYRDFLNRGKTERECVQYIIGALEKNGYISLDSAIAGKKKLKAGDKVYLNQMNKAVVAFHIGKKPLEEGMNIVGAHIDSPRVDLKQNPFYEDTDFALADTHYYGGIKKYQWVARQIALHGVVVKKDGSTVNICIGEKDDDPVVGISDLLPHLSQEQAAKKLSEAITGENLDIICADIPNTRKITHEDMLSLKEIPCRGKVIFSVRKYDDIDYIVPLPKDRHGDHVNIYMHDKNENLNRWRWEDAFDWIEWLNSGRVILKNR